MLKYYGAWHRKGVSFRGMFGKWLWPPEVQQEIDKEVEKDPVIAAKLYKGFRIPGIQTGPLYIGSGVNFLGSPVDPCPDNCVSDVWVAKYVPIPLYDGPFPDIAISKEQRETGYTEEYYRIIERNSLRSLRKETAKMALAHIEKYGIRKHKTEPHGFRYNEGGTFSWGDKPAEQLSKKENIRTWPEEHGKNDQLLKKSPMSIATKDPQEGGKKGGITAEIIQDRTGKRLRVLSNDAELVERHFEGGLYRCRYKCSKDLTFTFEKSKKTYFLFIGFDRHQGPEVISEISKGLQVLWELAHLPFATIYSQKVLLEAGREVELIDAVGFEVKKVGIGVWEAEGKESEGSCDKRRMKLESLEAEIPGVLSKKIPDPIVPSQAESPRIEVIFADRVIRIDPQKQNNETCHTDKDSASERVLEPKEGSVDLPKRRGPQAEAPTLPDGRNPNEIADCDGCEELFYERELIEIKPGLYVCNSCLDDDTLRRLGLTPDEMDSFWRLMRCDWCGQPLTEVEPDSWLCPGCFLENEVASPPSALEVEGMRWLEARIDIRIEPGKVIPTGKWIIGTRVTDGWKIGAEYSFAVESIWRLREKAGFDKSPIVKVDVEPSIIVPDSTVTPGGRVSWHP